MASGFQLSGWFDLPDLVPDRDRTNFIPDWSKISFAGIFSHPPSPTL